MQVFAHLPAGGLRQEHFDPVAKEQIYIARRQVPVGYHDVGGVQRGDRKHSAPAEFGVIGNDNDSVAISTIFFSEPTTKVLLLLKPDSVDAADAHDYGIGADGAQHLLAKRP